MDLSVAVFEHHVKLSSYRMSIQTQITFQASCNIDLTLKFKTLLEIYSIRAVPFNYPVPILAFKTEVSPVRVVMVPRYGLFLKEEGDHSFKESNQIRHSTPFESFTFVFHIRQSKFEFQRQINQLTRYLKSVTPIICAQDGCSQVYL